MPVMACCCGECQCRTGQPSSITIDPSGTWSGGGSGCWTGIVGVGPTTITFPDTGECNYGGATSPVDISAGGYAVSDAEVSYNTYIPCKWASLIGMFGPTSEVANALIAIYVQHTPNPADPTGIYDLVSATCSGGGDASTLVPPAIMVS